MVRVSGVDSQLITEVLSWRAEYVRYVAIYYRKPVAHGGHVAGFVDHLHSQLKSPITHSSTEIALT